MKTRQELFTKVKQELDVHEAIEEEIFYPALSDHPKTKELALEAYEEHHVVDTVMAEIGAVAYDDETWGAKFTVMKENLEHHIEEEEGEMFKQARLVFDRDELVQLGRVDAVAQATVDGTAGARRVRPSHRFPNGSTTRSSRPVDR